MASGLIALLCICVMRVMVIAGTVALLVASAISVPAYADAAGPTLVGVVLDTASADVSDGPQTVSGRVSAYDADAGVVLGFIDYTGPTGYLIRQSLHFGTPSDGTATAAFTFDVPAYIAAGDYTLSQLVLAADDGRTTTYPLDRPLPTAAVAAVLHVVDADPDTDAPTLVDVSTSTTSLDVSSAAGSLTVDVHLTDAGSGVKLGTVSLIRPSQQSSLGGEFVDSRDRVSGTDNDGVYEVTFPFDTSSETGNWMISVSVQDNLGNEASYTGASVVGTDHIAVHGNRPSRHLRGSYLPAWPATGR